MKTLVVRYESTAMVEVSDEMFEKMCRANERLREAYKKSPSERASIFQAATKASTAGSVINALIDANFYKDRENEDLYLLDCYYSAPGEYIEFMT